MNRYEKMNAIEKVAGYYLTRPYEDVSNRFESAFERAKEECLKNLREQIENIERLDFESFKSPKGKV